MHFDSEVAGNVAACSKPSYAKIAGTFENLLSTKPQKQSSENWALVQNRKRRKIPPQIGKLNNCNLNSVPQRRRPAEVFISRLDPETEEVR